MPSRLVELTHPEVADRPAGRRGDPGRVRGAARRGEEADGQAERWARFEIQCEEILTFGECAVALVHVEVAVRPESPTVTGDIAHLIEFDGDRARSFTAFRDRAEAMAAAQA